MLAVQIIGIGDKIAMEPSGQLHRDLHGLVVGDGAEFGLAMINLCRARK